MFTRSSFFLYLCLTIELHNTQASKDKERYAREMKDYTPPEGFNTKDSGKKKKSKKDPNAPKGGKSAYMCFVQENRSKIKEESPDLSFGELGKALGEKWKVISSEEKAKYEELAKKDKDRFKEEMVAYEAKKEDEAGDETDGMDDDDDDDSDDE
jgi:HMG (high mobility group) box